MDIELNFVRRGKGENLIFLHGNGEDLTYFEKQIEFFSHDFCVYAIDTRGHGKSPWGEAPFTIRQFADDLMEFMNVHKIEKANIVGFSDGANIAMIFALKYPEKVDKLVLNGGNLNGGGVKAYVQLPVIIGYKFARMFAGKNSEAEKHALMLGLMVNDPNIAPEQLDGIRAKTLVIAGSRDMIKRKHTELIFKSIPDARLSIIKGTHFIASENPSEFNNAVHEFLISG